MLGLLNGVLDNIVVGYHWLSVKWPHGCSLSLFLAGWGRKQEEQDRDHLPITVKGKKKTQLGKINLLPVKMIM